MELNEQPNAKRDLIFGTWYLDQNANAKGYLVLQKGHLLLQNEPLYPMPSDMGGEGEITGRGQRFEFRENGDFVDSYSEECGLDSQAHQWSGKWVWKEEEQSLFLRIETYPASNGFYVKPSEEYKHGEAFYITEVTRQTIQLSPKHPDVQLWV